MKQQDNEYLELRALLARMSCEVADMVRDSIKALVHRDMGLAESVIKRDKVVNELDLAIDEHCLKIFALYEPKAIDLRYIITASRIIVDLERVGDHCSDICKEAIKLMDEKQIKPYIDIPKMGEISAQMIENSIASYFEKDIEKAVEVIKKDDEIDSLYNQVFRELITYMADDLKTTKSIFSLMMIAKSLERIADYATNIGEMVYFMVTGEVIRHKFIEGLGDETHSDR